MMKQNEAVILALEKLGGVATLGQLNQTVMKIPNCKWGTKTPFASIRRIVQTQPKSIYKIKPGLYGLVEYKKKNESKGIFEETTRNKNSKELRDFNHSYYQGLLLTIGNLRGHNTFAPNQDKNRLFIDKKLGELRTLNELPKFGYPGFLQRSSTIDVIWFNERLMPDSFFEVEHSTDIQNSLLKYNDLIDFNSRMLIVADKSRKKDFDNKIGFSAFREIAGKVGFVDYETLNKQYEREIESQSFETIL